MAQVIGSINVDNGIRRIKVNEEGEYIEFSVNDSAFFERFADFLRWVEGLDGTVNEFEAELREKFAALEPKEQSEELEEGEIQLPPADIITMVAGKRTELHRECCQKLDGLFGDGCCRKVFGGIVPDDVLLMDFVEQICPHIERMGKERNEKFALKYNRNRRGKRSRQRTKEELIADATAEHNV